VGVQTISSDGVEADRVPPNTLAFCEVAVIVKVDPGSRLPLGVMVRLVEVSPGVCTWHSAWRAAPT
jgi:hypothetical protein